MCDQRVWHEHLIPLPGLSSMHFKILACSWHGPFHPALPGFFCVTLNKLCNPVLRHCREKDILSASPPIHYVWLQGLLQMLFLLVPLMWIPELCSGKYCSVHFHFQVVFLQPHWEEELQWILLLQVLLSVRPEFLRDHAKRRLELPLQGALVSGSLCSLHLTIHDYVCRCIYSYTLYGWQTVFVDFILDQLDAFLY